MRSINLLLSLLMISAVSYGHELCDFRIPKHTVHSLRMSLGGSLYGDRFVDDDSGTRYSWHNGNVGAAGYWLYDSEDFAFETWGSADFRGRKSGEKRRGTYNGKDNGNEANWRSAEEYYNAGLFGIYYPTAVPVGVIWEGGGRANASQWWSHNNESYSDSASNISAFHDSKTSQIDYNTSGEAGVGWGRIRDASGVYQVHILEERLRDMGRISGQLSAATRNQLSELYYTRSDYSTRWSREEKYFWKAVEDILKVDPALTGPLDAFAQYRIAESVAPSSMSRWSGMRLSFVVRGAHSNYIGKSTRESREHTVTDSGAVFDSLEIDDYKNVHHNELMSFGPRLEIDIPLSWNVQLTADSRFRHDVDPANDGFYWTNKVGGAYAMHDRWLVHYTFFHTRFINDPKERSSHNGSMWSIGHSVNLAYYVEDKTSITLSVSHDQDLAWDYIPNIPSVPHYTRHTSGYYASVNLSYSFSGWSNYGSNYLPRSHDGYDWYYPYFW